MVFFVEGIPVPKGSAKAFLPKGSRRPVVVQDNREKQKPWATSISHLAAAAMKGAPPVRGAVELGCQFVMPRPKSHYGTGRNSQIVKASAPQWHTSKPDLDKLLRCVKDALTGIVWIDDCQVAKIHHLGKVYGDSPGVTIYVSSLDNPGTL